MIQLSCKTAGLIIPLSRHPRENGDPSDIKQRMDPHFHGDDGAEVL